MSDSVRPHRRQPTRLPRPWDSPGKSSRVGCHFLLQCMKMKSEVAQLCPTLSDPMDCSLPGKSTGVGCHCLLHLYVYICTNTPDRESPTSNPRLSDPRRFPGCDISGLTQARPGVQPPLAPEGGSVSEPTVGEPGRQTRWGMGCWAAALAGVQAVCRPWPGERRAR